MPRYSPAAAVPLLVMLTLSACDPGTDPGLLAPEATPSRLQKDGTNIDSNVFILPPVGTSYTATLMDTYTPTRLETCTLNLDAIELPAQLEDFTDPDWAAVEGLDCRPRETDPGYTWYESTASWDGETFIELKTDADGNPQHYQVNLKPAEELADEIWRVKVFMREIQITEEGAEGGWEQRALADIALNENASLSSPFHGEVAGQNFAFKYSVEMERGDNFFAAVDCDGGAFEGTTAAAFVEPNTFTECLSDPEFSLILQQERVELAAGEVCLPLGWEQDGPCYHWQLYLYDGVTFERYLGTFELPMTVVYCLEAETGEWSGWQAPFPYDEEVYPTTNTSAAGIFTPDCGALTQVASEGIGGLLHGVRNSLARLIGLDPTPLYAADKGFGELVGSSRSYYGRAAGKELVMESGDGQFGLINATLPLPLVAQAVTVPHPGEDPESVPSAAVTFQVTSGGGYLTDDDGNTSDPAGVLNVTADGDGYAKVWWTLGPAVSPPDQTVDVYGDGFGFINEDNVFQAERTFTATAFDLAVDFREPLSASDAVSGDPHTLYEPDVWICPAPTDAQPCTNPAAQFDASELKKTEDNGRWFFQVNWKPRDFGIAEGVFAVQVLVGNAVVGESVNINVDKGGKVELVEGELYINPTTDLPIKFTVSQLTP